MLGQYSGPTKKASQQIKNLPAVQIGRLSPLIFSSAIFLSGQYRPDKKNPKLTEPLALSKEGPAVKALTSYGALMLAE